MRMAFIVRASQAQIAEGNRESESTGDGCEGAGGEREQLALRRQFQRTVVVTKYSFAKMSESIVTSSVTEVCCDVSFSPCTVAQPGLWPSGTTRKLRGAVLIIPADLPVLLGGWENGDSCW